jgi:Domain of unknown function (DUF1841)
MFNPSQNDVRRFFCGTWRKFQAREILTPLEDIAARWIVEHPEYHAILANEAAALAATYSPEAGQTNPFLHLSMHMTISEQVQIDQPAGIQAGYEALRNRLGEAHAAHHEIMECLGEMMWAAQRNQQPPDGMAYVECVRRRARLA